MRPTQKMRERHGQLRSNKIRNPSRYIIEQDMFHRISDSETLTRENESCPGQNNFLKWNAEKLH